MFTPPRSSRSNVKHACAALFVVSIAAAPLANAVPITIGNNSFEIPDLVNSYQYTPVGATWTFSGDSGISDSGSDFDLGATPAPDGSQYAFLQSGYQQAVSSFSQALTFPASDNYTLTFMAAGRPNVYSVGGNQSYQVLLDSTLIFADVTTTGSSFIAKQSAPFSVTAGVHTLSFAGLTSFAGGDHTAFIDAVAITPTVISPPPGGSVPEPASLALLGIGLAGFAAARRRKTS